MALAARTLLDAALALSEEERLALASELIASVEGTHDPDWDSAWLEELERRERAVRAGESPGSDWAEVRERLTARLTKR